MYEKPPKWKISYTSENTREHDDSFQDYQHEKPPKWKISYSSEDTRGGDDSFQNYKDEKPPQVEDLVYQ